MPPHPTYEKWEKLFGYFTDDRIPALNHSLLGIVVEPGTVDRTRGPRMFRAHPQRAQDASVSFGNCKTVCHKFYFSIFSGSHILILLSKRYMVCSAHPAKLKPPPSSKTRLAVPPIVIDSSFVILFDPLPHGRGLEQSIMRF